MQVTVCSERNKHVSDEEDPSDPLFLCGMCRNRFKIVEKLSVTADSKEGRGRKSVDVGKKG